MPGTTTGETPLPIPVDGDDVETYFVQPGGYKLALQAVVDLFNHTTGHDHSAAGKGAPVTTLTSAVVGSGGLQVTAGNVGIGQAPASNVGISQAGSLASAFGGAESQSMNNTLVASAPNDQLTGLVVQNTYNPNAQTGITSRGINVGAVTGAALTNVGVDVQAPSGATNNIGVRIAAPSGGSGLNLGLNNLGGAVVNGAGTSLDFFGSNNLNGKQPIVGSRAGNAALASLLNALAAYGLVTDSTTA